MIPKVIHYCWFGNSKMDKSVLAYIKTWKNLNPDYEIVEWNERNFDINVNAYVREAYASKKWAFVSDYARLYALYHYGGIYLDTDVEAVKPFDPLRNAKVFIGVESRFSICSATIGAEKGALLIKEIMKSYENLHFSVKGRSDTTPNSQRIFQILSDHHQYVYSGKHIQELDVCTVYPQDFFSPVNCYTLQEEITERTVSIHRYAGTWKKSSEKLRDKGMAFATRIIGEDWRNRLKKKLKRGQI